ncbi:MAG TPA: sigma-70 family RNA polymerase sigma factor [Vitreimonas sp.]|uniref:RNA polymerase sigma factor n=1 Tax=Vitreimonas sp. TaxID=3069702 RepID=UPI002D3AD70A|nr:sigma-70 family RNA polymerase sigma factor [Vitreimonas sp.]HYD88066.1 sigma-70 family RNA polymerase sigma factor [Vitreimonas sp.]
MTPDDEARLVAAARTGDSRAFAALVDAHQQAVRGFLRRFCGHWAEADDIAQEAFVTAWRKLAQFESRSSFRSWVSGIGFRIARDARRSHQRASLRDTEWRAQQDETEDEAPLEDRIALAEAMAALPEEQRAAVALCLGEGFSHSEAAAILKLPLGTVKSHVTRGRERLLQALETRDEE